MPIENTPQTIAGLLIDYNSCNPLGGKIPASNASLANVKNLAQNVNNLSQATLVNQCNFSVLNPIPSLRFSGEAFEKGNAISLGASTNYTCFIVYQSAQTNTGTMFANCVASTNGWSYGFNGDGNRNIIFHGAATKVGGSATTNMEMACVTWNGTISTLSINGTADAITNSTTVPVATNGSSHAYIGFNNDSDLNGFEGFLYRVLFYDRILSGPEMTRLNNYLQNFYGAR